MNSSASCGLSVDHVQINVATKECDTKFLASKSSTNSRRTPSLSSSSSSSSYTSSYFLDVDSPLSPMTPLRSSGGIPFSWEQLPGIPKKISHKISKKGSTLKLDLPLPPNSHVQMFTSQASNKRLYSFEGIGIKKRVSNDPFYAALVECSKDDHDEMNGHDFWGFGGLNKVTRSISNRFGFTSFHTTSCKSSCSVSEAIVYLPRSTKSTSYDRIHRRRSL